MASNNWIVPGAYPGNSGGGGGGGTSTVLLLSDTQSYNTPLGTSPVKISSLSFTVGTTGKVVVSGTATIFNNSAGIVDIGNYCELDGTIMSFNTAYDSIQAGASNYTLVTFSGFGTFIAGVHVIDFYLVTNAGISSTENSSYIVNAIVSI
jgi:hypothetical protein